MRYFGAILGVLNIMTTVWAAIGPVGARVFFDAREIYLPVFYFFVALMLAIAAVLMLPKAKPER